MIKNNEKIAYFISFILMLVFIYGIQNSLVVFILLSMFKDFASLFGGDGIAQGSLSSLPVGFILAMTFIMLSTSFILGWINRLRWIGALIIIILTLANLLLAYFVMGITPFDIGLLLLIFTLLILVAPVLIVRKYFKEIEDTQAIEIKGNMLGTQKTRHTHNENENFSEMIRESTQGFNLKYMLIGFVTICLIIVGIVFLLKTMLSHPNEALVDVDSESLQVHISITDDVGSNTLQAIRVSFKNAQGETVSLPNFKVRINETIKAMDITTHYALAPSTRALFLSLPRQESYTVALIYPNNEMKVISKIHPPVYLTSLDIKHINNGNLLHDFILQWSKLGFFNHSKITIYNKLKKGDDYNVTKLENKHLSPVGNYTLKQNLFENKEQVLKKINIRFEGSTRKFSFYQNLNPDSSVIYDAYYDETVYFSKNDIIKAEVVTHWDEGAISMTAVTTSYGSCPVDYYIDILDSKKKVLARVEVHTKTVNGKINYKSDINDLAKKRGFKIKDIDSYQYKIKLLSQDKK